MLAENCDDHDDDGECCHNMTGELEEELKAEAGHESTGDEQENHNDVQKNDDGVQDVPSITNFSFSPATEVTDQSQ